MSLEKTFEVEFSIDGVKCGSGFVVIRNGVLDSEDAEEEFYKTLRKNTPNMIEETREYIVDHLTLEQEDKLKELHAKEYHGTDDDMPDAFEDWLVELDYSTLVDALQ